MELFYMKERGDLTTDSTDQLQKLVLKWEEVIQQTKGNQSDYLNLNHQSIASKNGGHSIEFNDEYSQNSLQAYLEELSRCKAFVNVKIAPKISNDRRFLRYLIIPTKILIGKLGQVIANIFLDKQVKLNHLTLNMGYKVAALEKRILYLESELARINKNTEMRS